MPLYEYLCEKCGSKFEKIEKFSAEPLTVHEGCGGSVHRLISAPAFHLKGTGWYATDYAKPGSSSGSGEAKKGGSSDSKESKSTSTESTPAPATTTSTPASTTSSSSSSDSSKT